jgi:hypothetical protein
VEANTKCNQYSLSSSKDGICGKTDTMFPYYNDFYALCAKHNKFNTHILGFLSGRMLWNGVLAPFSLFMKKYVFISIKNLKN